VAGGRTESVPTRTASALETSFLKMQKRADEVASEAAQVPSSSVGWIRMHLLFQ
jgi:hypothetical protein